MLAFSTTVPVAPGLYQTVHKAAVNSRRPPCMGPWKQGEKDEAFRQQQEILARRRDKKENSKYFEEMKKRRESVEEYYDDRRLKVPIGEDPIIAWKKLKDEGKIDESQYTAMDEGGIPIPMASFGIPKYDNGGRFDLRLPHVEFGYSDPDADIMSKAGNAIKNLFGLKKEEKKADDDDTKEVEDNSDMAE